MSKVVLIAGITGYVGGRLLPLLARQPYRVRCLECWPDSLRHRVPDGVEVVHGDMDDVQSLYAALDGVEVALYLVHAQSASGETAEADWQAAQTFGKAARLAGVRRLVYFGGLGTPPGGQGRRGHDVSEALRASGVPVIELRASVIIGAGSLCFETIREVVERLPVIPAPRWLRTPVRPIFIDDILAYLLEAVDLPGDTSRSFAVAGPDALSYAELMREYARLRGLRRWMPPLPFQAPRLSRVGVAVVAPRFARVGERMIDGFRDQLGGESDPAAVFAVRPMGMQEALARAVRSEDAELSGKRWSQAVSAEDALRHWGGARYRNRFVDSRVATAAAPAAALFAAVEGIGGTHGWYSARWLWRLRGWMDVLVGGVGMRRGRRDPERLVVGDVVDCWRVVAVEPGHRLLLAADMKLPGRGWLEFEARPGKDERSSLLRQTASFDPLGLAGLLYWYLSWPFHQVVFVQMVRGLAQQAESSSAEINADAHHVAREAGAGSR